MVGRDSRQPGKGGLQMLRLGAPATAPHAYRARFCCRGGASKQWRGSGSSSLWQQQQQKQQQQQQQQQQPGLMHAIAGAPAPALLQRVMQPLLLLLRLAARTAGAPAPRAASPRAAASTLRRAGQQPPRGHATPAKEARSHEMAAALWKTRRSCGSRQRPRAVQTSARARTRRPHRRRIDDRCTARVRTGG